MWQKLAFLLVVLVCAADVRAAPAIQIFLSEFDGYRFDLQFETEAPDESTRLEPFAESVLLEAGFLGFSSWNVVRGGREQLVLDVFQMSDPLGAYELFTLWPDLTAVSGLVKIELPISVLLGSSDAILWRGYYFCHLRPRSGSELTEEAVSEIATRFVELIEVENLLPVSVSHLPEEGLVPGSTRFYLGAEALALNEHFPEPLLREIGLEERIEIAFAQYEPGGHSLFLVGYPTPALAEDYFIRLQNRLQGYFSEEGVYLKRAGVVICIFIGPEESARDILLKVEYTPTIKWLYKKQRDPSEENLTFLGLITQTILGIGVFLILVLAAGFATGLARYEVLRRFPQLTRRKEPVRLDLRDR